MSSGFKIQLMHSFGLVNIAKKKRGVKSFQNQLFEEIFIMKSHFSRFLHYIMSHSDVNPQSSDNDSVCTGRSMVEMLGVLAIIGVLSVGAIAGYSKAMMKYKLNKMVDQYNQLFGTIAIHREEFIKLSTPTQFVSLYPIIYKMGELPDGMKLTNDQVYTYDILKHRSEIRSFQKYAIMFYLQLSNSDEQHSSSPDLIDACRNMYQYLLIPRQDDVVYAFFYHNDEQGEGNEGIVYGNKACAPSLKCLKDLTVGDIDAICNSAQKNRETRLVVKF